MEEIKVAAELRGDKNTRNQLSELRKARKIPAVVYGGKDKPVSVTVGEKELMEALKRAGANAIIHLNHAKGTDTVILKELQRNVITGQPTHADFKRIDLKEKIVVQVPLHTVGEAPGVKLQGGILEHVMRQVEIRCLPTAIPKGIDVDISQLSVGGAIHIGELKIAEGIEVLSKADQVVVHVVIVKEEAAPAPVEGAAAAPGTEPEVIAKGKKDEEGAEAAAGDKKPAAAGDKKPAAAGDKKAAAPAAKEGAKKEK